MTREELWKPTPERVRNSQLFQIMSRLSEQYGFAPDWESFRTWSIDQSELFWAELFQWAGISYSSRKPDVARAGEGMLGSRWFPRRTLNYARHLLRFEGEEPAIVFEPEGGDRLTLSRSALRTAVARCARALRRDGVAPGDRVAGFVGNTPEAIVAMLAAASLGAIWSSCSPDFGVGGVVDRFGQIEPKVLVVVDGYVYAGKRFETLERVKEMLPQLPSVQRVVVVPLLSQGDTSPDQASPDQVLAEATPGPAFTSWSDYLQVADADVPELEFLEVPFDHPLFIMYSSGTTGVPKCIVHGHGGTLLQHMKELVLHCDLREGERLFYFTTCGWMMWNWMVSALGVGATVVLCEGNPGYPDLGRLWRLAQDVGVDVFGTSPKFLAACENAGLAPGRDYDLTNLRCVLSTGSPLSEEQFRWVYAHVKEDLQLSSISGGTDIISCFMLGNPILPVRAGEIQCRGLAMDVHAWQGEGQPCIEDKAELVCTSPFPSQPVGFWNDPDQSKYRSAYFEHYPEVWRHGDYVEITSSGGVLVHGRSDATLNPGGVRIGTAEIYRIVEDLAEVVDSVVVGHEVGEDVDIVLFVVLREGQALDAELEKKIRSEIAARATRRHVPRHVKQVEAVPYTISGKKVELAVQRVLNGQEVPQRDALANPDALGQYEGILD